MSLKAKFTINMLDGVFKFLVLKQWIKLHIIYFYTIHLSNYMKFVFERKPHQNLSVYVRAEDVDDCCIAKDSDDTNNGDENSDSIVPCVGYQGEVIPVGMNEEAVGVEDVSCGFVHRNLRHSCRG